MIDKIPQPPDDLTWLALTVYLEAEGESYQGKLAVAYSICNRGKRRALSISDTVFASFQYSAWNTDSRRRLELDRIKDASWYDSYRAASSAVFELEPDPSKGADHYLNVAATKAGRKDGLLPDWASTPADRSNPDPVLVTAVIDKHTFLRLDA